MTRAPFWLLLAVLIGPFALAASTRAQDRPFDQAELRALREEVEALQIAYGALLGEHGRNPEGGLTAAQRGRATRVHRALQRRTRVLRRPGQAGSQLRDRLEAERTELTGLLSRAAGQLGHRGLDGPAAEVRAVAERWRTSATAAVEPEPDPGPTRPLPDLDELTTRVWILRLARVAHEERRDARGLVAIDCALRYADLRLEGARWSEEAVALSRVAPPKDLARVVERAAEHFDGEGEARRAWTCRRLVRFYRGEPQDEAPPPEEARPARTEIQERHLRVVLAAREACLLAGEEPAAGTLARLARQMATGESTDLNPARITALLHRAAELHRAQGFPGHATAAEGLVEESYGTGFTPSVQSLMKRVERLERELETLRRRRNR